jgi:hypothetical protein
MGFTIEEGKILYKPSIESLESLTEVNALQKLLDFLAELEKRKIAFKLNCIRDAIMVMIDVPGERWEVEFFADGNIEVEVFRSVAGVGGEEELNRLFAEFSN